MPRNSRLLIGIVVVNLLLIAGIAAFNLTTIIPARGGGGLRFDFYPHWVGGRTLWSGHTPYTAEVTRAIQQGMFGETLPPEADQQNVAYPAYTGVMLWPIVWLPAASAIAVWMAIQLVAVIWTPILWLAILRWKAPPVLLFVMILAFAFAFHYPMDAFILAQFSCTVLLGVSLGCWLLSIHHDTLAGIAFALATMPPTVGAPIVGMILLVYALKGRWHGLVAFAVTMLILVGISIVKAGWWIGDWLAIARSYTVYANPVWPPNFLPFVLLRAALVIAVIVFLLWMLLRFWHVSPQAEPTNRVETDFFSAVIFAALFLLPQTGYYYLVLLIPALVVSIERARRLPPTPRRLAWLACALTILSPWFYFSLSGLNPRAQSLILPIQVAVIWLTINLRRWTAQA
jgi:hypothetical protein